MRRFRYTVCKVGGVGSSPWISCSAVRTISKEEYFHSQRQVYCYLGFGMLDYQTISRHWDCCKVNWLSILHICSVWPLPYQPWFATGQRSLSCLHSMVFNRIHECIPLYDSRDKTDSHHCARPHTLQNRFR